MLNEHDVVHGFLHGKGGFALCGLDVARRLHDAGQSVVETVQVSFELFLAGTNVATPRLFTLGLGRRYLLIIP